MKDSSRRTRPYGYVAPNEALDLVGRARDSGERSTISRRENVLRQASKRIETAEDMSQLRISDERRREVKALR